MSEPRVTIERIVLRREDKVFWSALEKVFSLGMTNSDDLTDEEYEKMWEFERVIEDMVCE